MIKVLTVYLLLFVAACAHLNYQPGFDGFWKSLQSGDSEEVVNTYVYETSHKDGMSSFGQTYASGSGYLILFEEEFGEILNPDYPANAYRLDYVENKISGKKIDTIKQLESDSEINSVRTVEKRGWRNKFN